MAFRQSSKFTEMVTVVRRGRIRPAFLENNSRDGHRKGKIAAGPWLNIFFTKNSSFMMDWIDLDQPCPSAAGIFENGHQVRTRSENVLAPQENIPGVQQIKNVVTVLFSKIRFLCGVPCSGADVTSLGGHGSKLFKEVITQMLKQAEGTTTAIVENRSRT